MVLGAPASDEEAIPMTVRNRDNERAPIAVGEEPGAGVPMSSGPSEIGPPVEILSTVIVDDPAPEVPERYRGGATALSIPDPIKYKA